MESQGCISVYIILSAKDFERKYRDTDYRPMVERMELGCIVSAPVWTLAYWVLQPSTLGSLLQLSTHHHL